MCRTWAASGGRVDQKSHFGFRTGMQDRRSRKHGGCGSTQARQRQPAKFLRFSGAGAAEDAVMPGTRDL
jgi:hypothetical protein